MKGQTCVRYLTARGDRVYNNLTVITDLICLLAQKVANAALAIVAASFLSKQKDTAKSATRRTPK